MCVLHDFLFYFVEKGKNLQTFQVVLCLSSANFLSSWKGQFVGTTMFQNYQNDSPNLTQPINQT